MKKTYIIPVTETTCIEPQTMIALSRVTNGSTAPLKDEYAQEGADALVQGSNLWDEDTDEDWRN